MTNRIAVVAMLVLGGAGLMPASHAADADQEVGASTREVLELQRSGKAAGPAQRLSGAAEARVYQRYLDSFTHPIPEFYTERESFIAEGDSGGQ